MRASFVDPLRAYLRGLSGWTWNLQGSAFGHGNGLCLHEETITEMLLLRMVSDTQKHRFIVKMFSKPQEKENGADWEWNIVTPFCAHKLRVQAKRLYNTRDGNGYGSLDLKSAQHATLISNAHKNKRTPVYVLYNHDHGRESDLFTYPSDLHFRRRSHWGCAIAHATKVKSNTISGLLPVMRPWYELVDPKKCGLATGNATGIETSPEDIGFDAALESEEARKMYLAENELVGVAYMNFVAFGDWPDVPR